MLDFPRWKQIWLWLLTLSVCAAALPSLTTAAGFSWPTVLPAPQINLGLDLAGGSRQSKKISEDFLEKYLNFRSVDQFANSLVQLKLVPSNVLSRKTTEKNAADFKYTPENFVRYSRTGGNIAYAFGEPTPADKEGANPGLWIEQDQFVVRKIKLPSQVEMSADNYSQFAKGLSYPRQRTIRWGRNTASVRVISISARASNNALFQASALDTPMKLDGLSGLQSKETILEFYSRFR